MITLILAAVMAIRNTPQLVRELRQAVAHGNFQRAVSGLLKQYHNESMTDKGEGYWSERWAFGPDQVFVIGIDYERTPTSMYVASRIHGRVSIDPIIPPPGDAPLFDVSGEAHERNGLLTICALDVYGDCSVPALLQLQHINHVWKPVATKVIGEPQIMESDGAPHFERSNGKVNAAQVVVNYRKIGLLLAAGHGGPWIYGHQVWRVERKGFKMVRDVRIETPFSALDRIGGYRQARNQKSFNAAVPPHLRDKLWKVLDPGSDGVVYSSFASDRREGMFYPSIWINRRWIVTMSKHNRKWRPSKIVERHEDLG